MENTEIPVVEGSDNVFADLALPDADELQMRAELTRQIYNRIKAIGLTPVQAAARLALQPPEVAKLMQGRFTGLSVDQLIGLLNALEIDVEIVLRPHSASHGQRGTVRVIEAPA
jgi:predicted XRE-type DNA-binding protein